MIIKPGTARRLGIRRPRGPSISLRLPTLSPEQYEDFKRRFQAHANANQRWQVVLHDPVTVPIRRRLRWWQRLSAHYRDENVVTFHWWGGDKVGWVESRRGLDSMDVEAPKPSTGTEPIDYDG